MPLLVMLLVVFVTFLGQLGCPTCLKHHRPHQDPQARLGRQVELLIKLEELHSLSMQLREDLLHRLSRKLEEPFLAEQMGVRCEVQGLSMVCRVAEHPSH